MKNYSNFTPKKPDFNAYYLPLGTNLAHISKIQNQKFKQNLDLSLTGTEKSVKASEV